MAHQHFFRAAAATASSRSYSLPVFIAAATSGLRYNRQQEDRCTPTTTTTAYCSAAAAPAPAPTAAQQQQDHHHNTVLKEKEEGFRPKEEGYYADLFPKRQLWHPKLEYPQWDLNWDGRHPPSTGDPDEDRRRLREARKHGITRHVILIRHGQYNETLKEDELRTLTPLGRRQAELTGQRLAEMIKMTRGGGAHGDGAHDGVAAPVRVKALRVSGMTRAKETAEIIAKYLPGVELADPDPLLSEGRPCHTIPGIRATEKSIRLTDEHHPRIEQAYQKYFYRSLEVPELPKEQEEEAAVAAVTPPTSTPNPDHHYLPDSGGGGVTMTRIITGPTSTSAGANVNAVNAENAQHEFEIIVCHANVIRYFLCRALQLPPEAWLRYCPFNCSMTYITIRPSGNVSCRMMGDIGHLPYETSSFSKHYGFNW